jgi:hypothetical protein
LGPFFDALAQFPLPGAQLSEAFEWQSDAENPPPFLRAKSTASMTRLCACRFASIVVWTPRVSGWLESL